MWIQRVTVGDMWIHGVTVGDMWIHRVTVGHMWIHMHTKLYIKTVIYRANSYIDFAQSLYTVH